MMLFNVYAILRTIAINCDKLRWLARAMSELRSWFFEKMGEKVQERQSFALLAQKKALLCAKLRNFAFTNLRKIANRKIAQNVAKRRKVAQYYATLRTGRTTLMFSVISRKMRFITTHCWARVRQGVRDGP